MTESHQDGCACPLCDYPPMEPIPMSDIPKPSEARCSHGVLITQVCAKCVAKNAEKDKGKGKK